MNLMNSELIQNQKWIDDNKYDINYIFNKIINIYKQENIEFNYSIEYIYNDFIKFIIENSDKNS